MDDTPPKPKKKKTHPWRVFHPPMPPYLNNQDNENRAVPAEHNPLRKRPIR